jgi:hypothetical protein
LLRFKEDFPVTELAAISSPGADVLPFPRQVNWEAVEARMLTILFLSPSDLERADAMRDLLHKVDQRHAEISRV